MLTLVTPPAGEPVSLAEAKLHLRVEADFTDDDTLISALITAARRKCEAEISRCFITSTWDITRDRFPWGHAACYGDPRRDTLQIPNPPLVSVSSLSYADQSGSTLVLPSDGYQVVAGTPGVIVPAYETYWPSTARYQPSSVTVRYVAGYGAASAVPESIKAAIKILLTYLYENRGDSDVPIPAAVAALLAAEAWGAYV